MTAKLSRRGDKARARPELNIPPISLMWPDGATQPAPITGAWENDLGLDDLVKALAPDAVHQAFIRKLLTALNTDAKVIEWRQTILRDFLNNPALVESVTQVMHKLATLRQGTTPLLSKRQRNLLLDTADRLSELNVYVEIVEALQAGLAEARLMSPALTALRDSLATLLADEQFQRLQRDLPAMRAPLENIRSLTIGINLDVELRPSSAALISINNYTVGERLTLLERLIGSDREESEERGIAPLHYTPQRAEQRPLSPLFQDLDRLLTQTAEPVANGLRRYVRVGSATLATLEPELAFYVGAVRLIERLGAAGVDFCAPEIAPMDERVMFIDGLSSISLALKQGKPPIPNAVELGEAGRIAILTGPNNGGKTTYLRSVGLAQAMFQAGLFIPAKAARISPVDRILTHFPAMESRQQGRLAEEAARLHSIFEQVSCHSLVLLNETFSSTSSGEGVYLARDILCGLRAIGARAIYATHLTELAAHTADIEAAIGGDSNLFCLTAGIRFNDEGQATPTYTIERGMPHARSYAQEIARHHGISLEQILQMRGLNGQRPTP